MILKLKIGTEGLVHISSPGCFKSRDVKKTRLLFKSWISRMFICFLGSALEAAGPRTFSQLRLGVCRRKTVPDPIAKKTSTPGSSVAVTKRNEDIPGFHMESCTFPRLWAAVRCSKTERCLLPGNETLVIYLFACQFVCSQSFFANARLQFEEKLDSLAKCLLAKKLKLSYKTFKGFADTKSVIFYLFIFFALQV